MEMVKNSMIRLATRKDLALVMLLMIIISVMILPLPTFLMDALIVLNISLTVLILMVSIYLHRADDFSVFPAVILLATTFRLAISISTTRLILSQADAGKIIETFGIFVTQGSVVVGLVIFIIITTVQFIVITKGSERVAEVAARFTLDAMPGRQMSIDAELRNGDIEQAEATEKRLALEKENKFFGAMDGAMKFVKGDAIAGIIIIIVNLAGGFGIGTISKGMSAGEAAATYSRLTIGDGLVSQIPALLLAICAGMVITRVTSQDKTDLGTDIVKQLASSGRTLIVAGIILGLLSFVPGFPLMLFLAASAIFIGSGLIISKREKLERNMSGSSIQGNKTGSDLATNQPDNAEMLEEEIAVKQNDTVSLAVGHELFEDINREKYILKRDASLNSIKEKMGQFLPNFGFAQKPDLAPFDFEINFEGVPVFSASIEPNCNLVICEKELLDLLNIKFKPTEDNWPIKSAFWVDKSQISQLKNADAQILDTAEILVDATIYYLIKNGSQLVGFEHIEQMLLLLKEEQPQLSAEVAQAVNATQLLEIVRRLVDESVPIYSRRLLFEGLLGAVGKKTGIIDISEHIRHSLRRQICQHFANEDNIIAGYVIEPDLETKLRKSLKNNNDARFLALDAQTSNSILTQIGRISNSENISSTPAVIVTASDIRPHLKKFIKTHNSNIDILAFQEISDEFNLRPVGTISLVDTLTKAND